MKKRSLCLLLAAALALSSGWMPMTVLGNDMDIVLDDDPDSEDYPEVVIPDDDPEPDPEPEPDQDPELETETETEKETQQLPVDDNAPLIEDDGFMVEKDDPDAISGTALWQEQEEENESLKTVRDFLESGILMLEGASASNLQTYLNSLLSMEDPTGSDGEMQIAAYIEEEMKKLGYTTTEQHFHEGFLNEDLVDAPGINIIAERGANSLARTDQILVLAAHYDSKTKPVAGDLLANDKSGAAVLMETARILSTVASDVDVCFLFFSGEEDGSYGSARFVEALPEEFRKRICAVLYLGPVGYVYYPGQYFGNNAQGTALQPQISAPSDTLLQEGSLSSPAGTEGVVYGKLNAAGEAAIASSLSDTGAQGADASGALQILGDGSVTGDTGSISDLLDPYSLAGTAASREGAGSERYWYLLGADSAKGNRPGDLLWAAATLRRATSSQLSVGGSQADFTSVPQNDGTRSNFAGAGMTAVSLFQNLYDGYAADPLTGQITAVKGIDANGTAGTATVGEVAAAEGEDAGTANTAGTGTATPPVLISSAQGTLVLDLDQLAGAADLFSQVGALYMQSVGNM